MDIQNRQRAILFTLNTESSNNFVDISKYSTYPEKQEVVNLVPMKLEIFEAPYDRSLGWQLKVRVK